LNRAKSCFTHYGLFCVAVEWRSFHAYRLGTLIAFIENKKGFDLNHSTNHHIRLKIIAKIEKMNSFVLRILSMASVRDIPPALLSIKWELNSLAISSYLLPPTTTVLKMGGFFMNI